MIRFAAPLGIPSRVSAFLSNARVVSLRQEHRFLARGAFAAIDGRRAVFAVRWSPAEAFDSDFVTKAHVARIWQEPADRDGRRPSNEATGSET
jgi:hypothetical protein